MILLQATPAPAAPGPPPMPAGAPWWAWLIIAVLTLVMPAVVQIILERRKRAGLARISKDVAAHGATLTEHGATLAALEGATEETDPAIVAAREAARAALVERVQKLESRADHVDAELKDIKGKMERRAEEDARAERELQRELGRVAGLLEGQNGSSGGARSRRG